MANLNDTVYIIIPTTTIINHFEHHHCPNNHNRYDYTSLTNEDVVNNFHELVYIASGTVIEKNETSTNITYIVKLDNPLSNNITTTVIYNTLTDAMIEVQKLAINTRVTFDIQDIPNINKI